MDIYQQCNRQNRAESVDPNHLAVVTDLTQKSIERLSHYGIAMVLGAGNCQDIPLNLLLETFKTVVLVDVDREALDFARSATLGTLLGEKLETVVTDLTGIHNVVKKIKSPIKDEQIHAIMGKIVQPFPPSSPLVEWQGQCDLTLSVDVVSQLVDPLINTRYHGEFARNPQTFIPLQDAVTAQHYSQIRSLRSSNGGIGLLAFELYSSESLAGNPIKMKQYTTLLSKLPDESADEVLSCFDKNTWTPCRIRSAQPLRSLLEQEEYGSYWLWSWEFDVSQIYLMMGWLL